jgi:hypothetical protein
MKRTLIAAVIGLSTLVLTQPAKADSNRSYRLAYKIIATSDIYSFKNEEVREYTLKWLEQDKDYPHKVAISYCQDRRSGFSKLQIIEKITYKLGKRKWLEDWSESRLDAYVKIDTAGVLVGLEYYCPEFLNQDVNQ